MNLYGPVRADDSVGTGEASVKLSLDWKGTAPTTHVLRVIDAAGGQALPVSSRLIRSLPHPDRKASISTVRFTPTGNLFVSGYPSGVIQLWDVGSGKELRRIDSPRGLRSSAEYAVAPNDFSLVYVATEGRTVRRAPEKSKTSYTIEYDGKVLVWDLATGQPRPAIAAPKGHGVYTAQLSPDGKRLITVEQPGSTDSDERRPTRIRMYDTATGRSWDLGEGSGHAVFSADGQRICLGRITYTGTKGASLAVFDSEGKQLATLLRITRGGSVNPLCVSSDGKLLAASHAKGQGMNPGTLSLFDLAAGKEIASYPSGGDFPFLRAAFSPDGRLLAASDWNAQMTIWDVHTRRVIRKQRFEGKLLASTTPVFSPDGTRLAVAARVKIEGNLRRDSDPLDVPQPRVYLFDLTREGPPEEIVCPHGWAGGVAFSADGKMLAVGGAGAVHLFDVARRRK